MDITPTVNKFVIRFLEIFKFLAYTYVSIFLFCLKSRIFKIAYKLTRAFCCLTLGILHGRCVFPALSDLPLCFSSWFVNITLNARHAVFKLPNRSAERR